MSLRQSCKFATVTSTADSTEAVHVGKRTGDSDTGQPRPTVIVPVGSKQINSHNVDFRPAEKEAENFQAVSESNDFSSVELMPNFRDVDCQSMISNHDAGDYDNDTLGSLLMRHFIYPLAKKRDPLLYVNIQKQPIQMLLDTGAHVSVLP